MLLILFHKKHMPFEGKIAATQTQKSFPQKRVVDEYINEYPMKKISVFHGVMKCVSKIF